MNFIQEIILSQIPVIRIYGATVVGSIYKGVLSVGHVGIDAPSPVVLFEVFCDFNTHSGIRVYYI